MNRNQLRYFVSAAEHRSFTKAAEQYYISQTAVTQQIQQLEQTLGCELFDRSTRPVSLTSAGKSFLLDAKAILERMSRAQERVHDAATGLTGTLRVGYVRGYERSDLSVLMRHFHQKNGNVLISFYRCSTDVLAAGLLHQEYDIVFTWDSTNLRTQEGVTFQTVEKARLVVALYAGHPLAQRRQLTRQELRGENILYMSPDAAPDSYGDAFFMQRYAEAGYKPNILFRSADTESILMMVAAEEAFRSCPTTAPTAFTMPTTSSSFHSWARGRRKRSSPPGRAAPRTRRWDGFWPSSIKKTRLTEAGLSYYMSIVTIRPFRR